ncbi:hypothetical protein ACFL12_05710 [Pseudomonadota bacterium]
MKVGDDHRVLFVLETHRIICHLLRMCNALSPEKAVIWSVLHAADLGEGLGLELTAEHFTYDRYRRWFRVCAEVRAQGEALSEESFNARARVLGVVFEDAERRALKRLFRLQPPPRIRDNATAFVQALCDCRAGRRVHIERLIN